MTTTASGSITTAEELLKTTLSGLSTFQAWVGASDAAGAAKHIYLEALPPDELWGDVHTIDQLKARRPCAMIWTAETNGFTVTRDAAPAGRTCSGNLVVRLEGDVLEAVRHDYAEVDRLFKNTVGGIVDQLAATTAMAISSITVSGPVRTSNDDLPTLGDAQMVELSIAWGVTQ